MKILLNETNMGRSRMDSRDSRDPYVSDCTDSHLYTKPIIQFTRHGTVYKETGSEGESPLVASSVFSPSSSIVDSTLTLPLVVARGHGGKTVEGNSRVLGR